MKITGCLAAMIFCKIFIHNQMWFSPAFVHAETNTINVKLFAKSKKTGKVHKSVCYCFEQIHPEYAIWFIIIICFASTWVLPYFSVHKSTTNFERNYTSSGLKYQYFLIVSFANFTSFSSASCLETDFAPLNPN